MEVFAKCNPGSLFIEVHVLNESTEDLGVFGSSFSVGYKGIIEVGKEDVTLYNLWGVGGALTKNMPGTGAIGTSTGFYISVDGETAIGFAGLDPVYGADIACVFMGSISLGKHNAREGTIEILT
jgi:hypothetical protein